jgi:DNA polymerase III epsilon subunit-like protein
MRPLVAHNADFDIAFLNAELKRAAKTVIAWSRSGRLSLLTVP